MRCELTVQRTAKIKKKESKRTNKGVEEREGERAEAVASRRVATSCNELHKRKRSHVILNEGLPHPLCLTPALLIAFLSRNTHTRIHALSLSLSFCPLFFSYLPSPSSACLRFIPSLFELVSSNLCLSLSLLVWFVGLRLGTMITEYPPLTSLVVLWWSSLRFSLTTTFFAVRSLCLSAEHTGTTRRR